MEDLDNAAANCAAFSLRRASRVITRRYEQALRPLQLSSFQFTALVALAKARTLPQTELAKLMGMDVSTLTRNLKPLILRQLVKTVTSAEDRRVNLVSLTKDGKRTLEKALPLWKAAQDETLKDLSEPEWATLKQAIRSLT
ncbi:MAG: MarR family transcriptional regulator [Pseudomonadota bacterium]